MFKGKLVHVNATVNFAQIVKRGNMLITVLHLSLKILFSKKNNVDQLNSIPTKAKKRSVIQILFRTQGLNIRQAQSRIPVKNYS